MTDWADPAVRVLTCLAGTILQPDVRRRWWSPTRWATCSTRTRSRPGCSASPPTGSCSASRCCPSRSPALTPGRRPSWPSRCCAAGTGRHVRGHPGGRLPGVRPRRGDAAAAPVRRDRRHRDHRPGGQPAQQPPRAGPDRRCWTASASSCPGRSNSTMTLRQVAETLVPQFADHCFIDLVQGDKLVRRVQTNAGGLDPAAGQLGQGRRAGPLPGGPLLPAGHGPGWTPCVVEDLATRSSRRAPEPGQPGRGRAGWAVLGRRRAAVRAR